MRFIVRRKCIFSRSHFLIVLSLQQMKIKSLQYQPNIQQSQKGSPTYLTHSFTISHNLQVVECLLINAKTILVIAHYEETRGGDTTSQDFCSFDLYSTSGEHISHSSFSPKIISAQMVADNELIYAAQVKKWYQKVDRYTVEAYSLATQQKRIKMESYNYPRNYWLFPRSKIFCNQAYSKQTVQQKFFVLKFDYYSADPNSPYADVASFAKTFKEEKLVVDCHPLNFQNKMGWVTKNEAGIFTNYILSLKQDLPQLQSVNVSFNNPNNPLPSFYSFLYQIEYHSSSPKTFLANYLIAGQLHNQKHSMVSSNVVTVKNGTIQLQQQLTSLSYVPQSNTLMTITLCKALTSSVFFITYDNQKGSQHVKKVEGLLDIEKNQFNVTNEFSFVKDQFGHIPSRYTQSVYQFSGLRCTAQTNGILINWTSKRQRRVFKNDHRGLASGVGQGMSTRCEYYHEVKGRITFVKYQVKDVFMHFLLSINQDFDDDLLCDVLALIS